MCSRRLHESACSSTVSKHPQARDAPRTNARLATNHEVTQSAQRARQPVQPPYFVVVFWTQVIPHPPALSVSCVCNPTREPLARTMIEVPRCRNFAFSSCPGSLRRRLRRRRPGDRGEGSERKGAGSWGRGDDIGGDLAGGGPANGGRGAYLQHNPCVVEGASPRATVRPKRRRESDSSI